MAHGGTNLAKNLVGPPSIVSKTSNAVTDVEVSDEIRYEQYFPGLSLNTPSNFYGLAIVQTLQLGKRLLISLHQIRQLIHQP